LVDELSADYYRQLQEFIEQERSRYEVYPAEKDVFAAFALTPFDRVRVLLLGQDPYHDAGQAHGLCFSVPPGVKPPPSLVNIFRELRDDVGCIMPRHGCLEPWAKQGVLLLNTVLTVRAHHAHSHRGRGWETFTDAVIQSLNSQPRKIVFLLWGKPAQKKAKLVDGRHHSVIQAPHPSPLSAHRGFLGSRPFSTVNNILHDHDQNAIDWCLPPAKPSQTSAR
jgi:uracil-DNA glycosylase